MSKTDVLTQVDVKELAERIVTRIQEFDYDGKTTGKMCDETECILTIALQQKQLAGAEAMREAAIEARPDGKPYPDSDTNEQRAFVSGWNTAIRNWYEAIRSISAPAPKEGESE